MTYGEKYKLAQLGLNCLIAWYTWSISRYTLSTYLFVSSHFPCEIHSSKDCKYEYLVHNHFPSYAPLVQDKPTYIHVKLGLESTKRDPISLDVTYFYLKFLNVHKKYTLKILIPLVANHGLTQIF